MLYATLCLWAYATHLKVTNSSIQSHTASNQNMTDDSEDQSVAEVQFAQIDRPCDDELVQLFVRKGDHIEAHIQGVGSLSGPHGSKRILKEGCKLLRSLWPCGQVDVNVKFLEDLATCDYAKDQC